MNQNPPYRLAVVVSGNEGNARAELMIGFGQEENALDLFDALLVATVAHFDANRRHVPPSVADLGAPQEPEPDEGVPNGPGQQ